MPITDPDDPRDLTRDAAGARPRRYAAALWPYALLLAVGLFVLLPHLGDYGFWDPWEPKYAESVREMYELDSYVVPYYRYEVRLTKPILVYWGIMAGSAVFGLNEFGARIVGVGMALGTMLAVFYAVALLRGRQAGLLAGLVLLTLPQFFFVSRQAMPDVYLFTSLGVCLLFLCLGLFGPDRRRDLHFGVSYACLGLAVLAKGPIVAGGIFFAALLVYGVINLDVGRWLQPDLRKGTLWFALVASLGTAALGLFSVTTFLFGTASEWWYYSSKGRQKVEQIREGLLAQSGRLHLAEALLIVLVAAAGWAGFRLYRNAKVRAPWRPVGAGALALAVPVALVALFAASPERKLFAAAAGGALACAAALAVSFVRFVHRPGLWEQSQPVLKQLGRQALLFVGVFVVVAGPWHLAILIREGHGYFTDFIIKHNITRATEKINSAGASDFYLRVLIFGFYPWCGFILVAMASLGGWWERKPLRHYGLESFMLVTSAVTFVMFSSSTTKFSHYLTPMLVPLAVLIALAINRTLERPHTVASRLAWVVAAMFFLLPMRDLVQGGGLKYLVESFTVKRWVPDELQPGAYVTGLFVAILILMLLSVLVRSRWVVGGIVVLAVLFAHDYTSSFIPALSRHKSMKQLCQTYHDNATHGEPIGFFGGLKHGIFFYTEHKIQALDVGGDFMEFMEPGSPAFSIIEEEHVDRLNKAYQKRFPGYRLYEVDTSHFDYHLVANYPVPGLSE